MIDLIDPVTGGIRRRRCGLKSGENLLTRIKDILTRKGGLALLEPSDLEEKKSCEDWMNHGLDNLYPERSGIISRADVQPCIRMLFRGEDIDIDKCGDWPEPECMCCGLKGIEGDPPFDMLHIEGSKLPGRNKKARIIVCLEYYRRRPEDPARREEFDRAAGRLFCHELMHYRASRHCQKEESERNCLTVLQEEFQAYYCGSGCEFFGGCFDAALNSACNGGHCKVGVPNDHSKHIDSQTAEDVFEWAKNRMQEGGAICPPGVTPPTPGDPQNPRPMR